MLRQTGSTYDATIDLLFYLYIINFILFIFIDRLRSFLCLLKKLNFRHQKCFFFLSLSLPNFFRRRPASKNSERKNGESMKSIIIKWLWLVIEIVVSGVIDYVKVCWTIWSWTISIIPQSRWTKRIIIITEVAMKNFPKTRKSNYAKHNFRSSQLIWLTFRLRNIVSLFKPISRNKFDQRAISKTWKYIGHT